MPQETVAAMVELVSDKTIDIIDYVVSMIKHFVSVSYNYIYAFKFW